MSEKIYEKVFSEERLKGMKASTLRELNDKEDSSVSALVAFAIVSFVEIIIIVASLLWMNKFTLFLSIVGALFVIVLGSISKFTFKDYKEFIKTTSKENAK